MLDGHIVLSRNIAETGLYPAIDIEASISRLMRLITTPEQQQLIRRFRQLNSAYAQNRDLITIGAYAKGSDPRVDEAIAALARHPGVPAAGRRRVGVVRAELVAALKALFRTGAQRRGSSK